MLTSPSARNRNCVRPERGETAAGAAKSIAHHIFAVGYTIITVARPKCKQKIWYFLQERKCAAPRRGVGNCSALFAAYMRGNLLLRHPARGVWGILC